MPWEFSTSVDEYVDAAWHVLAGDPEGNTIGLTVVENARHRAPSGGPPETYGWWTNAAGEVAGCVSITPPWPMLLLTAPEDSLVPLAQQLQAEGITPKGVNGATNAAATFAAVWRAATGQRVVMSDAIRLFGLSELIPSSRDAQGVARLAEDTDLAILVDWYQAFGEEVHHPMTDIEADVQLRMNKGAIWLWCTNNGDIVSMAGRTPPSAGVARLGPVYTPPEHRRHGYAEGLTHAVSADLLRRGLRVVLFTDQSNPTSNALYQRLGYRPIMDRMMLTFED